MKGWVVKRDSFSSWLHISLFLRGDGTLSASDNIHHVWTPGLLLLWLQASDSWRPPQSPFPPSTPQRDTVSLHTHTDTHAEAPTCGMVGTCRHTHTWAHESACPEANTGSNPRPCVNTCADSVPVLLCIKTQTYKCPLPCTCMHTHTRALVSHCMPSSRVGRHLRGTHTQEGGEPGGGGELWTVEARAWPHPRPC